MKGPSHTLRRLSAALVLAACALIPAAVLASSATDGNGAVIANCRASSRSDVSGFSCGGTSTQWVCGSAPKLSCPSSVNTGLSCSTNHYIDCTDASCGVCSCQAGYVDCTAAIGGNGYCQQPATCSGNFASVCSATAGATAQVCSPNTCVSGYRFCSTSTSCVKQKDCPGTTVFDACTNSCVDVIIASGTPTNGTLTKFVTANSVGNSVVTESASSVGIGTASPLARLSVFSDGSKWNWDTAGDFRIGDANYGLGIGVATAGGGAGDVRIFTPTAGTRRIMFGNNTDGLAMSLAGGNVGIGTASAPYKLTIYEPSLTDIFTAPYSVRGVDVTVNGAQPNSIHTGGYFNVNGSNLGNIGAQAIGTGSGTNANSWDYGGVFNGMSGGHVFGIKATADNGLTETTGLYVPVNSNTANSTSYGLNAVSAMTGTGTTTNYGAKLMVTGGANAYGLWSEIYGAFAGNKYPGIFLGGNVGIGTATPGKTLDVTGDIRASGQMCLGGSCISGWPGSLPAATAGQTLRHDGSNWVANSMLYNSGSLVGIGTATPRTALDVYDAIQLDEHDANNGAIDNGAATGNGLFFGAGGTGEGIASKRTVGGNRYGLDFYTGGTNKLSITWGGNVGIATDIPQVKLAVGGQGADIYGTDAWIERNLHVQGNECIGSCPTRGRLRVGTTWGRVGIYAETNSAAAASDLILGSSSGLTLIGPGSTVQSLSLPNGGISVGTTTTEAGNINQLASGTLGDSWGQWISSGSRNLSSFPLYLPAGKMYGTSYAWDSDGMYVGLKDEGSNRKDAVIAWGDDSSDSLRFLYNGVDKMALGSGGDVALNGKHAFRSNDTWLRLNQDLAFTSGVHTPGLFAPNSLNVGGKGGWVNPGSGNAAVLNNLDVGGTVSVGSTLNMASGQTISGAGRLHISSAEDIYLLAAGASGTVRVSNAWGGTGALNVSGTITAYHLNLTNGINAGNVISGAMVNSGWGLPGCSAATAGFSFNSDGCWDTGMFSNADGVLKFYANSALRQTYTMAGSFAFNSSEFSDARIKDDIKDYSGGLDLIRQVRPVSFVYNGNAHSTKGVKAYGVIAQEIQKVMPWAITPLQDKLRDSDAATTDILTVDMQLIWLTAVNAIKELDATMLKLGADGTVTVPGDLQVENNKWGSASPEISCKTGEDCECPDGMYITKFRPVDGGATVTCHKL